MKKKVFGFLSTGIVAVAMAFVLSPSISSGQTGGGEGGNNGLLTASQTKTVTEVWNATLKLWIVNEKY